MSELLLLRVLGETSHGSKWVCQEDRCPNITLVDQWCHGILMLSHTKEFGKDLEAHSSLYRQQLILDVVGIVVEKKHVLLRKASLEQHVHGKNPLNVGTTGFLIRVVLENKVLPKPSCHSVPQLATSNMENKGTSSVCLQRKLSHLPSSSKTLNF